MDIFDASTSSTDVGDFGFEGSGVVLQIGPGVKHLRIGDGVTFNSTGCFASGLTMSEIACAKIPASWNFEEAATIPSVYGTAVYGLLDLARLEAGQVSF